MELRHIRYFLTVVEEGNISRAAERIGIGQPPLSLQIRDLENRVGTRLFHRIAKGVELTAAGQAFHELVKSMPEQAERAVSAALRAARGELGSLRIGYTGSAISNPAVPLVIGAYRSAYPGVEIALTQGDTLGLANAVSEGEIDAAFLRQEFTEPGGKLQSRLLAEERLMAVLPTSHPAAAQDAVDLASLRDDLFVLVPRHRGETLFDTIMAACDQAGFKPRLDLSAPQVPTTVYLVAAKMGVSLAPESLSHVRGDGTVFRPLSGEYPTARLTLVWRRGDTSPFLRHFLDLAKAPIASV